VPDLELVLEPWALSVCRLDPDSPWPPPPADSPVYSVTRTPDELSVVCCVGDEPDGSRVESGWRALRVVGPLAFDLVGIVASVTVPLAEADVGVFVISTYDTDLVLVKRSDIDLAVRTLDAAGHDLTLR
jgi:hypothetical protein